MTKEELLRPRYKVIADYPGSPFALGKVFVLEYSERNKCFQTTVYDYDGDYPYSEKDFLNYPHIFQPLQWWQERKPEEMPEYVQGLKSVRKLLKIEDHGGDGSSILCEGESVWCPIWMFTPATEQEYNEYIKSKS